jgi:hypothetical protein
MSEQHKIKASAKRMEMVEPLAGNFNVPVIKDGTHGDDLAPYVTPIKLPDMSQSRPWHLMDNAPQDGTMIEVKEDPEDPDVSAVMVRYYHTSVRDRARRKWVPAAWWRNALTAERLSFEPFCWRMPDGFTQPGMIVA